MRRGRYCALKHAPDELPLHGSIHVHVEGQPGQINVVDVPLDRPAAETLLGLDDAERTAQAVAGREDGAVVYLVSPECPDGPETGHRPPKAQFNTGKHWWS